MASGRSLFSGYTKIGIGGFIFNFWIYFLLGDFNILKISKTKNPGLIIKIKYLHKTGIVDQKLHQTFDE
jgi:hypothetical protein